MTPSSASPDAVHVVLAVHDASGTYSQHAGVVMTSIFSNTKSPVCVHVLHDETLTDENRRLFLRTAEKFGKTVEFNDVTPYWSRLDPQLIRKVQNIFSIGTLYRLLVPDLLPVPKVIYLDCDILVNLDIRELWDIGLEGNTLAGVPDILRERGRRRFFLPSFHTLRMSLIGCDAEKYVNAGVLVMDLDKIREHGSLLRSSMAFFDRHRSAVTLADQDILNALFRGSVKILDRRFNKQQDPGAIGEAIAHASGHPKPWAKPMDTNVDELYWQNYIKSAWGEDKEGFALLRTFADALEKYPRFHRRTADCYRRIGSRLLQDLSYRNFFLSVFILLNELRSFLTRSFRKKA